MLVKQRKHMQHKKKCFFFGERADGGIGYCWMYCNNTIENGIKLYLTINFDPRRLKPSSIIFNIKTGVATERQRNK